MTSVRSHYSPSSFIYRFMHLRSFGSNKCTKRNEKFELKWVPGSSVSIVICISSTMLTDTAHFSPRSLFRYYLTQSALGVPHLSCFTIFSGKASDEYFSFSKMVTRNLAIDRCWKLTEKKIIPVVSFVVKCRKYLTLVILKTGVLSTCCRSGAANVCRTSRVHQVYLNEIVGCSVGFRCLSECVGH